MSTFFENQDGTHIEFGEEICDRFQKFLKIIDNINNFKNISDIHLKVYDDGQSNGFFEFHFNCLTISFWTKANPEGYSLSFRTITGMTGEVSNSVLQEILKICGNFSTTIKKPRYEVFKMVMKKFCKEKNIKFIYDVE